MCGRSIQFFHMILVEILAVITGGSGSGSLIDIKELARVCGRSIQNLSYD